LECQEDLLIKENKKIVKLKNAYALEVEKCENLTRELSMCNDSISSLRIENDNLNAKIEKLIQFLVLEIELHLLLKMLPFVLDVKTLMLKLLMITLL
jgi:hypothetical protein